MGPLSHNLGRSQFLSSNKRVECMLLRNVIFLHSKNNVNSVKSFGRYCRAFES